MKIIRIMLILLIFLFLSISQESYSQNYLTNNTPINQQNNNSKLSFGLKIVEFDNLKNRNRVLTASEIQKSSIAAQIFNNPNTYLITNTPSSFELAKNYKYDAMEILTRNSNGQSTTVKDKSKIKTILNTFDKYLAEFNIVNSGVIVIAPHKYVKYSFITYCMDSNLAAPKYSEKMRLRPVGELISPKLIPLYKNLMSYSYRNPDKQTTIQSIVWKIRNLNNAGLSQDEYTVLNQAMPNGANILLNATNSKQAKSAIKNFIVSALSGLASKYVNPHIPTYIPLNATDTIQRIANLERMPINEEIPNNNSEYTLLAVQNEANISQYSPEGVAARITSSGGANTVSIEFINTTEYPFTFNQELYSAQSSRNVQNLALGGVYQTVGNDLGTVYDYNEIVNLYNNLRRTNL